jgi:PAS domain S-box-containing protein
MHGYTVGELEGGPLAETLVPESRAALGRNMRIAEENGHHVYESRHIRKDGMTFPVMIDFAVLKDEHGNVVLHAAYCQDITDRKRLEQRVLETLKLESLGVLAGGMAHDFNNLLTSILGNANLALEEQPENSSARANLEEIIQASEKAAGLTSQMLAYSGKGRYVTRRVNLSPQVREIASLIRGSVPNHVQLEFDLSDQIPVIDADPSQIQQLILNLVVNAGEAIGERDGVIRIKTREETIDAEALPSASGASDLKPGVHACLEISDTGTGMDEHTLARIFDPFFTTKFPGRGLGLPAVSGIVRSHGGAVSVQSKLGEGSTFRVFFPPARN